MNTRFIESVPESSILILHWFCRLQPILLIQLLFLFTVLGLKDLPQADDRQSPHTSKPAGCRTAAASSSETAADRIGSLTHWIRPIDRIIIIIVVQG